MSRPSVFRRIASWLQNTAKINEKRRQKEGLQRIHRQYSVQTLEDRYMLDASFTYDEVNDILTFDTFTEVAGEGLTVSETADDYRFVLTEGDWGGVESLGRVELASSNDLRVAKVPTVGGAYDIFTIQTDDTIGIDILFDGVNFTTGGSQVTDFIINSSGGDISQTSLSSARFINFTVDGANSVDLRDINNGFDLIQITNTTDVRIRDGGSLNLGVIDVINDAEFENNGLLILTDVFTVGGDVLLNANNGDIYQERDAAVNITGETFLKSNATDEFGIDFGFGDGDGDGLNDNDFGGAVHVLQGAQIEIVDINNLTIGNVTTHGNNIRDVFQFYAESETGSVTIDGVVRVQGTDDADGKVIIRSVNGANDTPQGRIIADDFIVIGIGEFVFDSPNEVFDLNLPRPGIITGDVTGNLFFNNEEDLQVSGNTFEFIQERDAGGAPIPPITLSISALDIRQHPDGTAGNLTITTSDDNLTQSGTAPVIVESLTTIDVGTGNVTWEYGDELGDLLNDNNWNRITVVNATNASFIDVDSITIEDINVSNNARFEAENNNELLLDGELLVGNNLLLQSNIGASQVSGFVDAAGLLVQGAGNFIFDLSNRLGDDLTSGRVAADLNSGEFMVENLFGVEVASLNAFGTNVVGIDGVALDQTSLRGSSIQVNQVINVGAALLESDTTISQNTAITADSLIFRSNEDTDLSSANNVMTIAGEVEGDLSYNSAVELWVGELTYGGTTVSGIVVQNGDSNNFNLTTSDQDVHQNLDAPVVVEGTLIIDVGLGCVGFAFGDGNTDSFNDNNFNTVVINSAQRIELVGRDDMTTNSINVSDQIRLQSENGTIHLEGDLTATNIVLLQAGNGIQQNPDDGGVEGVINSAALMLQGDGAFILDHANEIGDAVNAGELAVEINGAFELNNIFDLVSKKLTFELKDGSTVTINGFIINSGGDALILNVSGLVIETEIAAPKIIINTTGDVVQGSAGRFITDALVLTGVGNFELTALNQIGSVGTPGLVAIDVEGDVEILNEFAMDFGQIVCGTDIFEGATLIPGTFAEGNLTLRTQDSDIVQLSGETGFTVAGTTLFDTGLGNVDLRGTTGPNDFNIVQIESANVFELSDINDVLLEESFVGDKMLVEVGSTIPGEIILGDDIIVTNELLLDANGGVTQQRGFIVADTLLLTGNRDFNLMLDNQVNHIAASIAGNLSLRNETDLEVVKTSYTPLGGATPLDFDGIDMTPVFLDGNLNVTTDNNNFTQASDAHVRVADAAIFDLGTGNLDLSGGDSSSNGLNDNDLNVLAVASATDVVVADQNSIGIDNVNALNDLTVDAEGGSISLQGEIAADNKITLTAKTGAGTRIGALLDTDTLEINGEGIFQLDGDNRIGAAAIPGSVGINMVDGDVILHNEFGVHFDSVAETTGDLFVKAGGSITDDDATDILVGGSAAFVASAGSDVELGGVNMVMATSVGLGGQNVSLKINNPAVLDGVKTTGTLYVEADGDITQSGIDKSAMAGSRFVDVSGDATFIVDSISGALEQRSVNLLSSGSSLMNNRFGGNVIIEGTEFALGGMAELGSVQLRNSIVDTAVFPTINRSASDQLSSLTVWAPNSSLTIKDQGLAVDYDVNNNMTVFAGVDSETGQLGGKMKVTDNSKTRSLRDADDVSMLIGGNFNSNAANTLILADDASNSIDVGGTLSMVNQGGANENRIRIGVGSGGTRGDDSGANVTASKFRARANRNGTDGHVTVNLDSDVVFTNSNFGTSMVVVAGGDITDENGASISVANSAFFDANGGAGNISLGDDNASNRTIFGSVGFKGNDVLVTEDTALRLNGSDVAGNFDVFSKGSIRQSGTDQIGRAGTDAIEVGGDAVFTVDGTIIPADHLADFTGRDVMLMNMSSGKLIDNLFAGSITIQSTQKLGSGNGTVRNVSIRNVSSSATLPVFNVDATDQLKNLSIWHPNNSVVFGPQANATDYDIAGDLTVVAGLESQNGNVNGTKIISDDLAVRDITDQGNVSINVGRNANFHAANNINLVDEATNSLLVGIKSTFVSEGGTLGNQVDVGTSGPRGTDSGGIFETARLKFTVVDNGFGGDLTIVADSPFILDPMSSAPDVLLKP